MKFLLLCICVSLLPLYADKIEFNQHIRPILSDKYFHCHGPDEKHIKGKLQLHTFEFATKKLGKKKARYAIVPGKVEESTLWERIIMDDEDDVMPPPETHKSLSDKEKALILKWIEQGAEYQDHWVFIPILDHKAPTTKKDWGSSKLDKFVLSALEKQDLAPMPEANKATLLRRLTFDITELPPTIEELYKFLADKSPQCL